MRLPPGLALPPGLVPLAGSMGIATHSTFAEQSVEQPQV